MTQIPCDLCQEEPAALLQTSLDDGNVVSVGVSCLLPFFLGAAKGLASAMDASDRARFRDDAAELAAIVGVPATALPLAAKQPRSKKADATERATTAAASGDQPGTVRDENPVTGDIEPVVL